MGFYNAARVFIFYLDFHNKPHGNKRNMSTRFAGMRLLSPVSWHCLKFSGKNKDLDKFMCSP
jgi:hypothetical protein